MATSEHSPFTPGIPVPVDLFTGRGHEVDRLDAKASLTAGGRVQLVFFTGERGIGKSSLAAYFRLLSERRHRLLAVHVFLGGIDTVEEAIRVTLDRLVKEAQEDGWLEQIRNLFGDQIQEVGFLGIKVGFAATDEQLRQIANNFDLAVASILEKVGDQHAGLLLIFDDIDLLAHSQRFADWAKSLVDGVATSRHQLPLLLLFVGLPERWQELTDLQPSLRNAFDRFELQRWSAGETNKFFRDTFGSVGVSVPDDALEVLFVACAGSPMLAHEIGDAAFRMADSDVITLSVARRAVHMAAEIVGAKHLSPGVISFLDDRDNEGVLSSLAGIGADAELSTATISERCSLSEDELLEFAGKLAELGVCSFVRREGQVHLEFASQIHRLYFHFSCHRAKMSQVHPDLSLSEDQRHA